MISRKSINYLLSLPNVVAVGEGHPITNGFKRPYKGVIVSVKKKVPWHTLWSGHLVPRFIEKVRTDVIETGEIKALNLLHGKHRPAFGGVSIGHQDITAGTFGCLVTKGNEIYILSNNHVLANSNNANKGDWVLQPGPHDGGILELDSIAQLADFVPIKLTGEIPDCPIVNWVGKGMNAISSVFGREYKWMCTRTRSEDNLVDAAIAGPVHMGTDVLSSIHNIGKPKGVASVGVGTAVQKTGRTTGHTEDEILQENVTVNVQYGEGKIATFKDQLMAGPMSAGGDSGSAVLNMNNKVVGLLFAGSEQTTIINKIDHVLNLLRVRLVV